MRTKPFPLRDSLLQLRQLHELFAPEFRAHANSSVCATQGRFARKGIQSALMPIAIPGLIRSLLILRRGERPQSSRDLLIQLELYALRDQRRYGAGTKLLNPSAAGL